MIYKIGPHQCYWDYRETTLEFYTIDGKTGLSIYDGLWLCAPISYYMHPLELPGLDLDTYIKEKRIVLGLVDRYDSNSCVWYHDESGWHR